MLSRRHFIQAAAAMGASLAWSGPARASRTKWSERRELYPHGVASGDPDPHSVILWTRRPYETGTRQLLTVEVAEDEAFKNVVAHAKAPVLAAADWTSRVLVAGLKPARTYWYRFTDAQGNGSRVGRTITAPLPNDTRPVKFAFVSCQDINESKLNGYRRMIFEDQRARPEDQLDFVLHLGDFIYEVVQYPEEGKPRFDARGISRSVEGLSRRSRPAGRPCALAIRVHLGQSRILVAGLAEHPEKSEVRAARAGDQGCGQSGLVRIYTGAREGAERNL
jgi:alkaline phosphatase D